MFTERKEKQRLRIKLPLLTYSDHKVIFTNPKLTISWPQLTNIEPTVTYRDVPLSTISLTYPFPELHSKYKLQIASSDTDSPGLKFCAQILNDLSTQHIDKLDKKLS